MPAGLALPDASPSGEHHVTRRTRQKLRLRLVRPEAKSLPETILQRSH